jgi:nucleoside-diphosphate-sugar epimerase
MTSTESNAPGIEEGGATAVVCDALDAEATAAAVKAAAPEVVVSQLTRLPKDDYDPRTIDYGPTNEARYGGGRNMIAAARAAGARRFVTQSIAFLYEPQGGMVKSEDDPVWAAPPEPFASALEPTLAHEREAADAGGVEGVVLRYGWFYGPGTYYDRGGATARQVMARRFPIVGKGEGCFSFIHVDDAAGATVAALDRGSPGIYNVVDDDPAPLREWLPAYAKALGAKRPWRVPAWLARLIAGPFAAGLATELRGASNEKAKRELGWQPLHSSWRQGFAESLRG